MILHSAPFVQVKHSLFNFQTSLSFRLPQITPENNPDFRYLISAVRWHAIALYHQQYAATSGTARKLSPLSHPKPKRPVLPTYSDKWTVSHRLHLPTVVTENCRRSSAGAVGSNQNEYGGPFFSWSSKSSASTGMTMPTNGLFSMITGRVELLWGGGGGVIGGWSGRCAIVTTGRLTVSCEDARRK